MIKIEVIGLHGIKVLRMGIIINSNLSSQKLESLNPSHKISGINISSILYTLVCKMAVYKEFQIRSIL